MDKTPLTIKEIHQGSLEILKKIISICEELDIDYFLAYGSLIGAVREKGFIPWDDDLDLIMLRPAYDKFQAYCFANQDALLPFKLMGPENNEDYPYAIDRFCDTRYEMVSEEVTDAGMGMFIDIYPFDAMGNDYDAFQKKYDRKRKFYLNCLSHAQRESALNDHGFLGRLLRYPIHTYAKVKGQKYFLNKLNQFNKLYDMESSKYVGCTVWNHPLVKMEMDLFREVTELPFEDILVKVPKNYDQVLKNSYNDYMKRPPESEQVATHEYKLYRKDI